jgi:hypothetical protein
MSLEKESPRLIRGESEGFLQAVLQHVIEVTGRDHGMEVSFPG